MRLFIAVPLSEEVLESILDLREPIRGTKWQKPSQMHLTLRFLGEAKQERFEEIKETLKSIHLEKFTIDIKDVGVFPDKRSPRVLWAGVRKSEELLKLQKKVEKCCQQAGFKPEKRSYKPHITFGRVKKASKKQMEEFIESDRVKTLSTEMDVPCFNLYRSELRDSGARHSVIQEYSLHQ
jgi:2'-5' RNA ligase